MGRWRHVWVNSVGLVNYYTKKLLLNLRYWVHVYMRFIYGKKALS